MKKLIFAFMIASLQYSSFSYGWEVRILPVNKDAMTGEWNGLFAHDSIFGWGDFRTPCNDEKNAALCAAQLLNKQTHGAYAVTAEQIEANRSMIRLGNNDIVFCIPVPYISTSVLHKKMAQSTDRGITKDSFAWLSMNEVNRRRTVIKSARSKNSLFVFDYGKDTTRSIIKEYWHSRLLPELNAANPKIMYQRPQSVSVKKHVVGRQNKIDPKEIKPRFQMKRRNFSLAALFPKKSNDAVLPNKPLKTGANRYQQKQSKGRRHSV